MNISAIYHDTLGSLGYRFKPVIIFKLFRSVTLFKFIGILKNQIYYGRFKNALSRQFAENQFVPKSIVIEITYKCNLKCSICYAKKTNSVMSLNTLETIVEQGEKIGCYRYFVMGGEPLLEKEKVKIIAEKHRNSFFTFCTNGTMIDDDVVTMFKPFNNIGFLISLDGLLENTNNQRGKNVFEKVESAMKRLRNAKMVFALSVTLSADNWKNQLTDKFINYCQKYGVVFFYIHLVYNKIRVGEENINRVDYLLHLRKLADIYPIFIFEGEYGKITSRGIVPRDFSQISISPEGFVRPHRTKYDADSENIKDKSLVEILSNSEFINEKRALRRRSFEILGDIEKKLKRNQFKVFKVKTA